MLFLKRLVDLIGAAVLLVLVFPVMLCTALLILFCMGRPVLFLQKRAGYRGKPFVLLKFRTMREAFASDGKPLPDSERLTSLGRLLRRASIDELPQILNVMRGEMSLFGPRPLLMQYLDRYTPEQARRLDVKPGLTGWAQVNGRNAISWEEKFALDVWYVDNWGLRLDAWILLRTVWSIVFPQGISHLGNATMPEFMGTGDRVRVMDHKSTTGDRLAIERGAPLRTTPFPSWPVFDDEEIEAVSQVLRTGKVNYWTGRQVRLFEEEFAERVGCRHAVAVANGTLALELALCALGIGPGDEVIVTSRSFVASASCCLMRGAIPVFADVDPASQNLTAETIRAVLTPRTRAIIAVHLAGWPCEMDSIMELAQERGLRVVEDCAQAHGATYRGQPVGSLGHVAAFSFCQDKILTTGGEGGMLTTNDEVTWEKAWSFKDHGKSWQAVHQPNRGGTFKWVHESLGTNWRMTEMQAAIGRVMLRKLSAWVETRQRHAAAMNRHFARLPALRVTIPPDHIGHSYYRNYVFLRPEYLENGWSRDRIVRALQAEGIPCGSGTCPEIYLEKAFDRSALRPERRLPTARALGQTSLAFLVHPTLSGSDVLDACLAVEKVLGAATVDGSLPTRRAA